MPDFVIKAVEDIVSGLILKNNQFYFLVAATTFVSTAISVYVSSYFSQRGKSLATKADFDVLLEQLRKTTIVSESLKSYINSKHVEEENFKVLLREKLESIFNETFKLELWLEQARSRALEGVLPDVNESPIAKIEMYQAIYFKESHQSMLNFQSAYCQMIEFVFDIAELSIKGSELPKVDNFNALQKNLMQMIEKFRRNLLDIYAPPIGL